MEVKQRVRSLGGVIRVAVAALLIGMLLFLVVRWFQNRQAVRQAEEATHTSQNKPQSGKGNPAPKDDSSSKPSTNEVPSGIADNYNRTNLPGAGMDGTVFLTAAGLAAAAYVAARRLLTVPKR